MEGEQESDGVGSNSIQHQTLAALFFALFVSSGSLGLVLLWLLLTIGWMHTNEDPALFSFLLVNHTLLLIARNNDDTRLQLQVRTNESSKNIDNGQGFALTKKKRNEDIGS